MSVAGFLIGLASGLIALALNLDGWRFWVFSFSLIVLVYIVKGI